MDENDFETGEIGPGQRTPLTEQEIKTLAKRMYANEIFTSMQVREENLLQMIFMPLMFMDTVARRQMVEDDITHFYSEMKDASPRGINGYPMFMSVATLTRTEAAKLVEVYNQILKTMDEI